MSSKAIQNVHSVIKKHSLPISHKNQSLQNCLGKFLKSFYFDLKDTVINDYPNDFPSDFYDYLLHKCLPIINTECAIIWDILKLDNQIEKSRQFDSLMQFLIDQKTFSDNLIFRVNEFKAGSLMARIRPKIGLYERKELFHIPYTCRKIASSGRFSIPGAPCLYLSVYRGWKPHNYEMVKAAWIECGMPDSFTYCIYELQKNINVLHFGKSGYDYLSEYDCAKDEKIKKDRLEAIAQYLLTFPLRAACHISVESKTTSKETTYFDEYLFSHLLMQWLQNNSKFDGVYYQGASSNCAQKGLYIGNVALPARNISAENEYDPYLKECFKLSNPKEKILSEDFRSNELESKIEAMKKYLNFLGKFLKTQNVPLTLPYTNLFSCCQSLYQIYIGIVNGEISNYYEKFISLYDMIQSTSSYVLNYITAKEWVASQNSDKPLTEIDFELLFIPFNNIVIPICREINKILYLQDCGSFLQEMNFQYI